MTRRSLLWTLLATPALSLAQDRKSPHESVDLDLGGKKIEITYGRPSLRGRSLSSLAPEGKVWRLGADEATKLTLSSPATLNSTLKLPAGSYALFVIPGESQYTVIANKKADQWGAFDYDEKLDAGRFQVPVKKPASPVEQFTIQLTKAKADTASVTMMWGDASVSFPVQLT